MQYLIANWKMKLTIAESVALARQVRDYIARAPVNLKVVLCPSFPALPAVREVIQGTALELGAQDVAHVDRASLTGAVSALQLKELGVTTVLVGHSERRAYFSETNDRVGEKTRYTLAQGLRTVVCVGESSAERAAGMAHTIVAQQVHSAIEGATHSENLIIAYEPVWAIGTGIPVELADAQATARSIAQILSDGASHYPTHTVPVLYGGSVDHHTIGDFTGAPLSGTLVGNASQTAQGLIALLRVFPHSSSS